MGRRHHTPEQIITKLREAEVLLGKGQTVGEACRRIGVTEQTIRNWEKSGTGDKTPDGLLRALRDYVKGEKR